MSSVPPPPNADELENVEPMDIAVPDDIFPRKPDESEEQYQRRLREFLKA
jgi:hypothetical protein